MDPQKTRDGKPYGPVRYEELVRERYLISKRANISYSESGKLTPTERKYITKYVVDEINKEKELTEQYRSNKRN